MRYDDPLSHTVPADARAEWKYGVDDQTEWYLAADLFSWRKLSAAAARMQHARDAEAMVNVTSVPGAGSPTARRTRGDLQ